jgi:hypothetical protein
MIRTVTVTRYLTPLREGGSLPGIVEADDLGTYVLKFRGAGQGPKALIAELVAGELARALGLPVPEIVFAQLDATLGRSEPDPEIQALIQASDRLNLALDYLPGALPFDPLLAPPPDAALASRIVWFDAFVTNVDRTPRNTNMLVWHKRLWLIDHGAALFFHHTWTDYLARSRSRFPQIREHVLLPLARSVPEAAAEARAHLTPELVRAVVALIPDEWLAPEEAGFDDPEEQREAYAKYLLARLDASDIFVEEIQDARAQLV